MKKIVINLSNKWFYTIIAFVVITIALVGVYAYNSGGPPSTVGHSHEEIELCSEGQVLQTVSGAWTCVDMPSTLSYTVIEIGDWNMDNTLSVTLAHGLTAANIRFVDVTVRDDTSHYYKFAGHGSDKGITGSPPYGFISQGGRIDWDSTNIYLIRYGSGPFDSTDFDATSYNRGWVTIGYE